jgi:hypothetical protein
MGAAAYRRGSEVIAKQISRDYPQRHKAFEIMDRINALPKHKGDYRTQILGIKHVPFTEAVAIEFSRGVWWLMDPSDMYEGFSYCYKTLEALVQSWDVYLTGYDETTGIWTATAIH